MRKMYLIFLKLLVTTVSCYNLALSPTDKDELWGALLRGEIGHNYSTALPVSSKLSKSVSDGSGGVVDTKPADYDNGDYNDSDNRAMGGEVNEDVYADADESDKTYADNVKNRANVDSLDHTEIDSKIKNVNKKYDEDANIKFKREHVKTDDEFQMDRPYQVISVDDFDKYIPDLMNVSNSDDIEIINGENGIKTIKDMTKGVRKKSNKPKPGQTSLVIVFDGTGSMENCLIQLRSGARQIIEKFADRDDNPIFNYIFVPFRDPHIGPELVTTDQQELLDTLENLRLWGGGDCPESAINGILASLKYALPKSYVYIFTDAIAKDFGMDSEVLTMIQKKQTSLTFLLTGFCKAKDSPGYEVFERLAAASNGQVYNLKTHDIKDVLDDIKNSLDTRRVALRYLDSASADTHNIDVVIDDNLKEFSVSVAGHNPNITVVDPHKKLFEDGKETLNLENLKVVNVQNPMPGEWNVKAESDSAHSVRLTALSDVVFNFGFSLKPPSNIEETLFNPLLGEENILSVSPSNTTRLSNLTDVRISLYYDKSENQKDPLTFQLDLRKLQKSSDKDDDIYVTKPFQPPRQPFKIDINGYDENGNPLKRLLSTVLQSTEESPPDVTIDPEYVEVNELQNVSIKCHAQSQVPVTILWKRQNRILLEKESDQTTSLDYEIESINPSHAGLYTCYAVNKKGFTESKVEIKVNLLPLTVTIPQKEYEVMENETVTIQCNVSRQTFDVQWMFNETIIGDDDIFESRDSYLMVKRADRSHSGVYNCIARTLSEMKFDSTMLKVFYPPEIEHSNEVITAEYHSPLAILCNVIGEPMPRKWWTYRPKFDQSNVQDMFDDIIEIEEFMPINEGTYICEADNGVGKRTKMEFDVVGIAGDLPKIEQNQSTRLSALKGTNLMLGCRCQLCMPLTSFLWSWNATELHQTNETIENIQAIRQDILENRLENEVEYNLIIGNISESNAGVYSCKLSNEYGFDEVQYEIEVLAEPLIEEMFFFDEDHSTIDTIFEGSLVFLKCNVKGSPTPFMEWYKNGVSFEYDEKKSLDNITLRFDNVNVEDNGVYMCRARNKIGAVASVMTLTVVAKPRSLLNQKVQTQSAIEGEMVSVPCPIYGIPPPTITWYFNDKELVENSTKYSITNEFLSFISDENDSGIYECKASNPYGVIEQKTVVVIYVRPKIIPASDEIIEVKSGNDIAMKCEATGYPLPNIKWTNDGKDVTELSSTSLFNIELILNNVTVSDEGAFTCQASNRVGAIQKTFFIVVNEPPQIVSEFPEEVFLIPGESLTVACKGTGNPAPEIAWKLGNNETESTNGILNISGDNPSTAGEYLCQAKNPHGIDVKKILINIIEPPKLVNFNASPNASVSISMGADLELICPFTNYNRIMWTKNNKSLHHNHLGHHHQHHPHPSVTPAMEIVDEPRQNNLYFPYVAMETAGNYTCFVENEAGQRNFTFCLNVRSPPQILDNDDYIANDILATDANTIELTVKSGDKFQLECLADGNPEPMIQWKRNNEVISFNKHLRIDHATFGDSGVYKCVATNSEGVIEKDYSINIITKPTYNRDVEQYFEINKGDSVTMDCVMQGNPPPQISWTKDEQPLNEYQEIYDVTSADIKDSGIYRCIGRNHLGYENVTFHVLVFEHPIIRYVNENTTYIHPQVLNLTCKATGSPTPILSWTYNGQLLISTARIHSIQNIIDSRNKSIFIDEHGNGISFPFGIKYAGSHPKSNGNNSFVSGSNSNNDELHMDQVNGMSRYGIVKYIQTSDSGITVGIEFILTPETKFNSGRFTCVAINAVGKDEKHTFIERIVPPAIGDDYPIGPLSLDILDGLPLILKCYSTGFPIPDLYWYKDTHELRNGDNIRIMNGGKLVTILQSSIEDRGIYSCLAKNIAGQRMIEYNVTVFVPPKIRYNSTNVNDEGDIIEKIVAKEGDHLQLHCPAIGYPEPSIIWTRYFLDRNEEEILYGNSTKLDIRSISDSSTYICFANSTFGEVRLVFEINVHKSPKLESPEDVLLNVKLNHGFTLHCAVYAEPEPNITWYKDEAVISDPITQLNSEYFLENRYISTDGQHLRILTASKQDSGRYVCKAHNGLGLVKKVFNVIVYASVHWSPWGFWTECSTTCGNGVRKRHRICLQSNGKVSKSEDQCIGESVQTQKCQISPCPIDGDWSEWSFWSQCSLTCINENSNIESIRERRRRCDSPAPQLGGKPCIGSDRQEEICSVPYCPINGGWSTWSDWSTCSASCGIGTKIRYRKCNNPPAVHGGAYCDGANVESATCYVSSCAIHGGWSDWSPWSGCSKTCGRGQKYRKRECNSPTPTNGGSLCEGAKFEMKTCKVRSCRNFNLVKSQKLQSRYTPLITIPVNNIEFSNEDYKDFDRNYDSQEAKYEYSEGRPIDYIPPPPYFVDSQEEFSSKPQKVVIRVENYIPISDDTAQLSINLKSGLAPITLSKTMRCDAGFEYKEGYCQDVDECLHINHQCSDYCLNIPGNYMCRCYGDQELAEDGRTCIPSHQTNPLQRDEPTRKIPSKFQEFVKYAEFVCPDGFNIENEACHDVNECAAMTADCSEDQTCLNTHGSYLCVPTPCPDHYDRHEVSGQCVQMCSKHLCTDGATTAQSVSYTALTMKTADLDSPILKLVSYDIYQRPLINTDFVFSDHTYAEVFVLENIPEKMGIVYLYAKENIQNDKIYKVEVTGRSYDQNGAELLYITRFIVYVYIV